MLRQLADVGVLSLRRAARGWLAAVSIPVYTLAFIVAAKMLAPLGIIGSLILGFVSAALCAGYLSLLASVVAGEPIRLRDLKSGMRAIWDVMSVFFAMWIVSLVLGPIERGAGDNAVAVAGIVQLAIAIFLNALPEVIYNGDGRSFAAFKESASFVMEHPVAWFAPNLVLAFVFFWATGTLSLSSPGQVLTQLSELASAQGVLALILGNPYWKIPVLIVFVHYAMVFRGVLYRELRSGSGRMRAFRRRMAA
ncbi:MAG TPA: hypothetical protein VHJ20_23580 [Polyangia bacterium]|nr:hypothetical protein [Polyangia bacterium]